MSSMSNLSQDGEFRYILQWFNEWSELQREDFVPVLVSYLTAAPSTAEELNSNSVCMNGLVHAVNNAALHDRPMSLFQCRIKLFRQWSIKWPQEFKLKMQQSISEIDAKVADKIKSQLKREMRVNGGHTNGHSNDVDGDDQDQDDDDDEKHVDNVEAGENDNGNEMINASTVMRVAQSIVDSTEAFLNADSRLAVNQDQPLTPVAEDSGPDNNSTSTTSSSSSEFTSTNTPTISNNTMADNEPAEPVLMAITPEPTAIPI